MESATPTTAPELNEAPIFREAFERVRTEIDAIADSELLLVNLEISAAVTTLLGRMPRLKALRSQVIEKVPSFDISRFDKLADYGMATWHAHTLYQNANKPAGSLQEMADAVNAKREMLVTDLTALVKRGLVRSERLAELKGPNGYRAIADDVFSVVNVFRSHWDAVQGKTAVQLSELTEAELAASRLITSVGLRDGAPTTVAESALTRQRAFTLFMKAYDDARRVVIFLRWHEGDADDIAPSLYAGRSNGRRRQDSEPAPATTTASAQTQPITPVPAPAPSAPSAPVGLPGSNPFV